jgi:hypothetical protein
MTMRELPLDCFVILADSPLGESLSLGKDRTLAQIDAKHRRETEKVSQFKLDKVAKRDRMEMYRLQLEQDGEIEYDVDEDRLYRNQMAFVGAMVRSGQIEASELEIEPDELPSN